MLCKLTRIIGKLDVGFYDTFLAPHPKNYIPTEGFGKLLGKDIVAKCNL